MPMAMVVFLRGPQGVWGGPADLGRAAHAAVLRLVAAGDAALAERLHQDERVKPLTVSLLSRPHDQAGDDGSYAVRITALEPALEALVATWTAASMGALLLVRQEFAVERVVHTATDHLWAGQQGYEAMLQEVMLGPGAPPSRWVLQFDSPVTFRQRGMNQPLPLPDLVFGSLLDKWNWLSPLPLPEAEVRAFVSAGVAVNRFALRSAVVPTKNRAVQIGAVGRCTYVAMGRDRAMLAYLDVLARFAFYCGMGAGTARGFGRTRCGEDVE